MSALTEATIIIEASETSGTLTQARAALARGRKLFILESCFRNPSITWPARFEAQGHSGQELRRHQEASPLTLRLTLIDELIRKQHHYLEDGDLCYCFGEYTARQGTAYSKTNQLIINLKGV